MSDDQKAAEQRRRMNLPAGMDPRNYDPRRVMDPASMERLLRAQAIARAQTQAATTVLIGTVVTLVTSAFGFVAALAWNDAIIDILNANLTSKNGVLSHVPPSSVKLIYALIVTLIAVIVVVILNRVAGRIAKKSAIDAATVESGSY